MIEESTVNDVPCNLNHDLWDYRYCLDYNDGVGRNHGNHCKIMKIPVQKRGIFLSRDPPIRPSPKLLVSPRVVKYNHSMNNNAWLREIVMQT